MTVSNSYELEQKIIELTADLEKTRSALKQEIEQRRIAQEEITGLAEKLKRRNTAFETVNRELQEFNYSVSHDLRAPIRHICGFTRILLDDYSSMLHEDATSCVKRINKAGKKLDELINALLKLSRVSQAELNINKIDLSAIANEIVLSLQQNSPDRKLSFNIEEGLLAQGDQILLWTVLEKLLGNACKFTSKNESATIEFGTTHIDGQTAYFVRDNGAGFEQNYEDHLFSPFRRLHKAEEYPGIGIGLAMAQRIIHRHGGTIWGEGKTARGATFYFTLSQ